MVRLNADPNYYFAGGGRSYSSATDADEDMALATIMALHMFGTSSQAEGEYYWSEAMGLVASIRVYDINNSTFFVKNGDQWGDESGWNPSYFAPAWYRVFANFDVAGPAFWNNVINTMYSHMNLISWYNYPGGLFPDWCSTAGGYLGRARTSDRSYLVDGQVVTGMQSFNYYYDAVRVPWRLALDYSWYGSGNAYDLLMPIGEFFANKVTNLADGYSITGGPWAWTNRDGFNDAVGGLNHSDAFVAMNATPVMAYGDANYARDFYDEVLHTQANRRSAYTYYGHTLRLLSLLYLGGDFVNWAEYYGY
jgi:endo-1,4-beta-D-glucanase Y